MPWSPELAAAVALGAASLAVIALVRSRWSAAADWAASVWTATSPVTAHTFAQAVSTAVGSALAPILLPVAGLALVVGLLQTRFLVSLGLFRIDSSRFGSGLGRFIPDLPQRVGSALVAAAVVVLYLLLATLAVRFALERDSAVAATKARARIAATLAATLTVTPTVTPAVTPPAVTSTMAARPPAPSSAPPQSARTPESAAAALETELGEWSGVLVRVAKAALAFLALVGIASRFLTVLAYRRRHRMSREELEQEAREAEGSQELRRFMRGLGHD